MGRAMDAGVDALAPDLGLAIEVIDFRERDAWPEILFDKADRAFNFPFRLRGIRLADPWRDANGRHEVGKAGVPARLFLLHFQQHTLHAVGEGGFG